MRLTRYIDYSMRVLMYIAAHPDRLCAISEMARAYGISQNLLMKVVHQLGKAGYVTGVRGRCGGVRLARSADTINVGSVIRHSETQPGTEGLPMLDCPVCPIVTVCELTGVVEEALAAFFAVFGGYTLAELTAQRSAALTAIFAPWAPAHENKRLSLVS